MIFLKYWFEKIALIFVQNISFFQKSKFILGSYSLKANQLKNLRQGAVFSQKIVSRKSRT